MKSLANKAEEILFPHAVMKRDGDKWALFSIKSSNDPSYVWWIESASLKNSCLVPLWVKGNWKRVKWLDFEDCLKLALTYQEFNENSEWF